MPQNPVLINDVVIYVKILILGVVCKLTMAQYSIVEETDIVQNFGRCITPNRENALCIGLEDCTFFYNLLTNPQLHDSNKLYLSRSQCGYRNGKVLICCPDRYRQTNAAGVSTVTSTKVNSLLPQPGQCGTVLSDNRIYGGNETKINEFPWMGLIEYTKPGGSKTYQCVGSLINSRYVVTAAHCINGVDIPIDWKLSGVRLGEWDTKTNPDCQTDKYSANKICAPPHQDIAIEAAIAHPNYNPLSKNQNNDIALLRLVRNVVSTDFVRPICLPLNAKLRNANLDGVFMDVSGWGKTESEPQSPVKRKASLAGTTIDKCQRVFNRLNIRLDNTQLCAGGVEGVDSCRGDSGGPLIGLEIAGKEPVYHYLAGIVSFGPSPCALNGWPGVYTRVGAFVDWIQSNIKA